MIPVFQRLGENCREFKASFKTSLGYILSFKLAWAIAF